MNRKGEAENDDPYELVRKLRNIIQAQKQTLEEYTLICDSITCEKNAALKQSSRLRAENQHLVRKIQKLTLNNKSNLVKASQNLFSSKQLHSEYKSMQLSIQSPLKTKQLSSSNLTLLNTHSQIRKKQGKNRQFIPRDVQFTKKKYNNANMMSTLHESSSQILQQSVGQFLIQDFLIISPDILQLKKKRQLLKQEKIIRIDKFTHFNFNKIYNTKKSQYIRDISNRSFPLGANSTRRTVENLEQFKIEMEFISEGKMNESIFILNLKGDFNEPPLSDRVFLGNCNPFRALFAVCLKVPDFIPIKDEKYYQRSQQQIWKVQKAYVILTYYPFIDLHLSILTKIHNLLKPHWQDLHREEVFTRNLSRNIVEAQKNETLSKIIHYFMGKIPDFNQICQLEKHYYGTLPNFGKAIQYVLPRFACSIFFSIFAYEELLLLLSALFLEKTIIFVGKSESATTLCALFLVTCISPFIYNHHLILNCNEEMIQNIVFGFPLPLVATLKKDTATFPNILMTFIQNTTNHFRGFQGKNQSSPLILVDVDSNTIFYDHQLNKVFQKIIVQPSKQFRQAYHQANPSNSKSFTFPKKMPVEIMSRPKNDYQKNAEEKKKLLKEYQQKIDNNMSKWPTFQTQQCHLVVLNLLTDYIHSFSIDRENIYDVLKSKENRVEVCRQLLIKKHSDKQYLIEVITGSQIFADYLDLLEKNYPAHFYQ